jgi:3-phenylpropionate/trans-cinnamate dioxygenase ferredoxin subunit
MWVKCLDLPPKEGETVEVEINQRCLLIICKQGKLYCVENNCPHEGVKLSFGCLKGARLKCSLHGFSFDLATGKSDEEGVDALVTYPIKQEQGVYILL